MNFVIDEIEVVHHAHCEMIYVSATTYKSIAKTSEAMLEHLAQPDVKDNRAAAGPLAPCDQCLLGLPLDED